jgi:hypothetical protein
MLTSRYGSGPPVKLHFTGSCDVGRHFERDTIDIGVAEEDGRRREADTRVVFLLPGNIPMVEDSAEEVREFAVGDRNDVVLV